MISKRWLSLVCCAMTLMKRATIYIYLLVRLLSLCSQPIFNKSQQYAADGRRTPFPWLLRRHSKVAAVLSVSTQETMNDELLIDMSGIMDEETFHEYVSKKLDFPGYYGYNLDAFWDCISDEDQSAMPRKLVVEGLAALKHFLPELHDGFVESLQDYATEHPEREVVMRQD